VGRHAKPQDFVLPSESGAAIRPRSAEALRAFLTLVNASDLHAGKPIDYHALRRSFATWLARAGVERSGRKLLLGHVEGDVTEEHYIERDLAMLHEAVCRIRLDLTRREGVALPFPAAGTAAFPAVLPAATHEGAGQKRPKSPKTLAPSGRIELPTFGLGNRCSIH
jgi:hypothetical protein